MSWIGNSSWPLFKLTKSKGHKSNFHISQMYRLCFYNLKVHFWWPNKCSKHQVLRSNTLYKLIFSRKSLLLTILRQFIEVFLVWWMLIKNYFLTIINHSTFVQCRSFGEFDLLQLHKFLASLNLKFPHPSEFSQRKLMNNVTLLCMNKPFLTLWSLITDAKKE